ncbi:tyrosine/serine/threonine protein phosphatase [Diatrype stigma]|uniref:protein-tyrosine-phosphatase n=1 Tax=Diatrype stigma TaxID=117547 RepID=A0AAN9UJC3_9PEZI
MSIYDPEAENGDERGLVTMVDSNMMDVEPSYPQKLPNEAPQQPHYEHQSLCQLPTDPSHRHNDSTSTQNFESAESSPTTTLTTDTSSLSDPSPSSSPDSPVNNSNLIPLNPFTTTNFSGLPTTMNHLTVSDSTLVRPMTSPSPRRGRNLKGLYIQPPGGGNISCSNSLVSEPSSPSFIKPTIHGMKRKPSQLSLKTDSTGLNIRPTTLEVPSSPALPPILQRRSLKHSTSSPHMLSSLKSATFGPAGGMGFPPVLERGSSGLSEVLRPSKHIGFGRGYDSPILEEESSSPIRAQVANRAAMDFEPFHEAENNEDQKSPGYPDGPIAIYEDNVFLYAEPTADEASKFDVVINVAREVLNPFEAGSKEKESNDRGPFSLPPAIPESPVPDTAMTNDSFATAFEYPPAEEKQESPTTPKANTFQEPEYIHMPWDHNTDIATDLMMLCEKIEKRTSEGKKVLVHCQQGASRSASLIIAYGLYQNPGMSVNDAYYSAQKKSRWISPNMRLMYCLQDFQKEVMKKRLPPRSAAGGPRTGRSPTKHRLTLSADAIDIKPKEPLTAPLPDQTLKVPGSDSSERSPKHARGNSTSNLDAISPGPSSAPSSFTWTEKEDEHDLGKFGRFNFEKPLEPPEPVHSEPEPMQDIKQESGSIPQFGVTSEAKPDSTKLQPEPLFSSSITDFSRPPPSPGFALHRFGESSDNFGLSSFTLSSRDKPQASQERDTALAPVPPEEDTLMSPRAETMTDNPLHSSYSELAGFKFIEQPPTPNEALFSPRSTMFPRDPLYPFGRPSQVADPRSPPTRGETPIVRSIDDML